MYARTLISPDWRMRGRIAIDAMILTGADAEDNNQSGRWEGGEAGWGWWWSKANLEDLGPGRRFLNDLLARLGFTATVDLDAMPWGRCLLGK